MTLESETVLDRRRLRRHVSFWRILAIVAVALALAALSQSGELGSFPGQHQIARVSIEGTITEDRDQLRLLKKAAEATHVSAILLFVNSPGGTTAGGEALYETLRTIAKLKPIVAQFGTVAASAAYIAGLGADHIVARGNTITGSVGVIAQWPEVTELLAKLGIKMNEVKSGELKAVPSPFEPLDERSRQVTQEMIDEGFQWFISLVEARRGISRTDIPGLVEGRIFSGRQALGLRLIDEVGGEEEAVRWLVDKRNVRAGLKVIDWKPSDVEWGFSSAMSGFLIEMLGGRDSPVARLLSQDRTLATLGLDGLVSIWHPSEK